MSKPFHVARVCDDCPYRRGGVRLRRERIRDLIGYATDNQGAAFYCHKTTGIVAKVKRERKNLQCAGALIFAEKQGVANQITRIMGRLGFYDPDALMATPEAAEVYDSPREMLAEGGWPSSSKRSRQKENGGR